MRPMLIAAFLSAAALLHHAGPAAACVNDRDTARVERAFQTNYEFKSGYQVQEQPSAQPAGEEWGPVTATGSGLLLMAAAAGLVTFNYRRLR